MRIPEEYLTSLVSVRELSKVMRKGRKFLFEALRENGYLDPVGSSRYLTFAERHALQQWFCGEEFGDLESYVWGFYLGDGKAGDPSSGAFVLQCQNPRDFSSFMELCRLLGVRGRRSSAKIELYFSGKKQIENLTRRGLLFGSKCKELPVVDSSIFNDFQFLQVFRGYVDTDGCVRRYKGVANMIQIESCWLSLLEAFCSKLKEIGVDCLITPTKERPDDRKRSPTWVLNVRKSGVLRLVDLGIFSTLPEIGIARKRFDRVYMNVP